MTKDETRCIKSIYGDYCLSQCSRRRGHGPDGLYCKQHDPKRIAAKDKEKDKIRQAAYKKSEARHLRIRKALKLIEGIPTDEIKDYKLVSKES